MMDVSLEMWLMIGALGIAVISLLLVIILWAKMSGMRKKYTALLNGTSDVNVEELLIGIQQQLNVQLDQGSHLQNEVTQIQQAMKLMKSKVNIHRYSAFGDIGSSDLSFSIAILDDMANGVVLTGIHSREQTYIYAKPIQKGVSTYTLSPEEKEAINRTMQQGTLL
ncbi:DUF4446 family protein [Paenibacillus sp. KN14-4R]|uniref:DUF4446 family protein n=1 Tax=Paenibacillus sp. KN14-4R TaxID=3445773 RepID=UPI003FA120B9